MKATAECFACVIAQAERNLAELKLNEEEKFNVMKSAVHSLEKAYHGMKPIELSKLTNDAVKSATGVLDPYALRKSILDEKAIEILPEIIRYVRTAVNPLKAFAIVAILGNHLDFGVNNVSIDDEFMTLVKSKKLAIDNFDDLEALLTKSKLMLYILDNTGEAVFDKIFIDEIKDRYNLKIKVAVRSAPIINDMTKKEAIEIGFSEKDIIDSGSTMAGMTLKVANEMFMNLWKEADIIISKGQGNFEGLDEIKDDRLFFLLESKCPVISKILGVNLGDIVMKRNILNSL